MSLPHPSLSRLLAPAICLMALITGCDDVQVNWAEPQARAVRPAGRPIDAPASAPAAPASESVDPVEQTRAYQLVLLTTPGPEEAPPGMRHVRLQHAPADALGSWLCALCVPCGGTGTARRYTLIYPTAAELSVAAGLVPDLDIPPADPAAVPAPVRALRDAIRTLYADDGAHARDVAVLGGAGRALCAVAADGSLPVRQRWLAGMLGGGVLRDCVRDTHGARACYDAADNAATPGSYEQMASMHARGRLLLNEGDAAGARRVLQALIAQFGAYRDTEVFERARSMLAGLDRRR